MEPLQADDAQEMDAEKVVCSAFIPGRRRSGVGRPVLCHPARACRR